MSAMAVLAWEESKAIISTGEVTVNKIQWENEKSPSKAREDFAIILRLESDTRL